jgi:tRNA(Ile2) C34 agmatinyltransferase TiaS
MMRSPVAPKQTKEELRAESERLLKEAMERQLTVKQIKSRKDAQCGKCGAITRVHMEAGKNRTQFKCKECGLEQMSL